MKPPRRTLLFAAALANAAFVLHAQPDPPGRVARLAYSSGQVTMMSDSLGPDWLPAQVNYPLTTTDQIWTDIDGRAELHLGTAMLRLREQTNIAITMLDDRTAQIQLASGVVNVHVRTLPAGEVFEVDTPNAAFTARRPGDYRIEIRNEQTRVTVLAGAAEISGANRNLPLRDHDLAVISGFDRLSFTISDAPGMDEFDRWCMDRNRRFNQSQSAHYVSASMIGYEDLDGAGAWRQVPNLGMVWAPRVEAGWAPYKNGHWAWVEPWGWTWIDEAPWGFAPFHYGRWAFVTGSWVWVPGPPAERVVYAPALVAWAGGGAPAEAGVRVAASAGFRISASIGAGMAWFALGPGEVYVPAHRASEAYVHNVNISNTVVSRSVVTNVYNTTVVNKTVVNNVTYVNQTAPGAVVGMSHADMAAGRRTAVSVPAAAMQTAQVSAIAPVPAARPAMQAPARPNGAAVARPPAAVANPNRPAAIRNQPPPAEVRRPQFTPAMGGQAPARPLLDKQEAVRPAPAKKADTKKQDQKKQDHRAEEK